MITLDTYRIAAIEQLRTYADIIGVPMSVARNGDELRQALEDMKNLDVVLIDTAGRSQKDVDRIKDLADLLAIAKEEYPEPERHADWIYQHGDRAQHGERQVRARVALNTVVHLQQQEAGRRIVGVADAPAAKYLEDLAGGTRVEQVHERKYQGGVVGFDV